MSNRKVIFFAPNVHTGGGLTLLKSLIVDVLPELDVEFILDERARNQVTDILSDHKCHFFSSSMSGRWKAERKLQAVSGDDTVTLCFHNLPPILNVKGTVKVFLQNRLLVDREHIGSHPIFVKCRLGIESIILRKFAWKVSEFLVQTQSMARHLDLFLGNRSTTRVKISPFFKFENVAVKPSLEADDFYFYISSGDTHKNHENLLIAWQLLQTKFGRTPKLLLTVADGHAVVVNRIKQLQSEGIDIDNLGSCEYQQTMATLERCKALIFPSFTESFGLPLIEASRMDKAILASELDYVRDVCEPVETFDPTSPLSIARAVARFEGKGSMIDEVESPTKFWRDVVM
ncbi:glycosyltransferase [Grimontia sp. NTOU-MAR1]|uniref:glycosyltransferase n=1 Tax=Grimontia sp. NTOU-MAR1 TaxID=3111011 RepID=UPI002DBF5C96|nr:glycosyltransferase [Grimontia sp. NTOU-MAR1]WRV97520.1 glycosyltransferase [Grimontia sp. NTOU-MAR1]